MFTLGIPKRDYRRATQVLGYESAEEIPYNATLQEDGFYIFTFPEVGDEYSFRKIANRLKSEGIRVIGADAQLTEKKIMKLASLINLEPLKEIDLNDPALMRARAAKGQGNQMKSNPRISFDQVLDLRNEKQDLELEIENIYSQMQNDPDIEPEGGPLADEYGDKLNRLETRLYKVMKQISSYDMNEGEDEDEDKDEDDEQKFADAKADYDSVMNESTEAAWNAIKVSRKAEKELNKELGGNKKWNERTAKKLDMLKAMDKAGKFRKSYDGEKGIKTLQGWVDQDYSWERLSKQFEPDLKESLSSISKQIIYETLTVTSEDGVEVEITDPRDIEDFLNDRGTVYGEDSQGGTVEVNIQSALDWKNSANEGSCGYGPDGVPGDTPGGTQGMDADDRTRSMMKKLIQKEIKKLSEGEPGDFDKGLEDLMGKGDFEKATSKKVPSFADMKPKEKKSKFKKAGEKSGFDMRGLK